MCMYVYVWRCLAVETPVGRFWSERDEEVAVTAALELALYTADLSSCT